MDAEDIKTYLTALSEQLELQGKHDVELVVCGGAALSILGLSQRTTRDIDAMALMVTSQAGRQSLVKAEFDDRFERAAEAVARDYGLPEDWINCGPADQLDTGLPDGFQDRLISVRYGENLVVHYCSRTDLIYLIDRLANEKAYSSPYLASSGFREMSPRIVKGLADGGAMSPAPDPRKHPGEDYGDAFTGYVDEAINELFDQR